MLILLLPAAGIVVTFARVGVRSGRGLWTKTEGKPAARLVSVAAAGALAAVAAYIWWPNGDYRPIQPGEKGTIQGAVAQFGAIPTGRPGLTAQRAQQLGGAPFQSQQLQNRTKTPATGTQSTTSTSTATTPTTQTSTTETSTNQTVTTGSTVSTPAATVGTDTTATVTTNTP